MCGLVGAVRANSSTKFESNIKEFMWQGLYISALRGFGGTGVGLVDSDYVPTVVKSQIDAASFVMSDMWDWPEKNLSTSRVILGHTRAPTGATSVAKKNSHPFMYHKSDEKHTNIMLTHNGHISNYHSLTKSFSHPVDSAHVAYAMVVDGEKAILEKANGAYVFIWYNEKEKTFNISRDDSSRELYLALSKDGTELYYSSEEVILQFLISRCGLLAREIIEIPSYTHHVWDLTLNTMEKPRIRKYEKKVESWANTNTGYWLNNKNDGKNNGGTGGSNAGVYHDAIKPGTLIWVDTSKVLNPWKMYQKAGGQNFGYMNGERNMDHGLVLVHSVTQSNWDRIKTHCPTAVPAIVRSVNHPTQKGHVPEYICGIDFKALEREISMDVSRKKGGFPAYTPVTDTAHAKECEEQVKSFEDTDEARAELQGPVGTSVSLLTGPSNAAPAGSTNTLVGKCAGPKGTLIDKEEWRAMAKEGCVYCPGEITDQDMGQVEWFEYPPNKNDGEVKSNYSMVCRSCKVDDRCVSTTGMLQ